MVFRAIQTGFKMLSNMCYPTEVLLGLLCILRFAINYSNGQLTYRIEMTKATCTHNSSFFKSFECSIRNEGDHQIVIDGRLELAADIEDFKLRTSLHVFRKNVPRMKVLDITINGCEFLYSIHRQKVLMVVAKTLKKYLNVMPMCPLSKNFNYTLTGYKLDADDLPKFFPEGLFRNNIYVLYDDDQHAKVVTWGRVVKK